MCIANIFRKRTAHPQSDAESSVRSSTSVAPSQRLSPETPAETPSPSPQQIADNLTDEQIDQFEAIIRLRKKHHPASVQRYMQEMIGKPGHTPLAKGGVKFTNPRLVRVMEDAKVVPDDI